PLGASNVSEECAAKLFGKRRVAQWAAPSLWVKPVSGPRILRFIRGQHWSNFSRETRRLLRDTPFTVMPDSDRMGIRLEGAPLERTNSADLLSEAVAPGTVQ